MSSGNIQFLSKWQNVIAVFGVVVTLFSVVVNWYFDITVLDNSKTYASSEPSPDGHSNSTIKNGNISAECSVVANNIENDSEININIGGNFCD